MPQPVRIASGSNSAFNARRRSGSMAFGLLFWWFLFVLPASAQFRFDHWTTDNGLPQNTIRSLVQTRDGYLWFTTFDGLVRFDGVRFTVFDKSNTPELANNRLVAIIEDKRGSLYAATEEGEVVVYRDGAFTFYPNPTGFSILLITDLGLDPDGEVLVRVGDQTFYLRDGEFIPAPPEYQTNPLTGFYFSPSGRFWSFDRKGLNLHESGRVIHYPFTFEALNVDISVKLYEDRAGGVWVGSPVGLYRLQNGLITRYTEKDGLPPRAFMRPYCEDNDGGIWFIVGGKRTPDNRLARFKDGRFTLFGKESGMPKTDIGQIIIDDEGAVWIGTSTGLYRARKQIVTSYSIEQGLASKEVYPLLETRNGDILVGTTRWVSRLRQGRFTTLPEPQPTYDYVQSLWEDESGRLWIGIVGGLHWYENGKVRNVSSLVDASVWAVRSDREGNVWVGSARGLLKFKGDRVEARYTTDDGLPGNDVKVIHESPDGTLWIGTYGGLAALKDGKFTSWTTRQGLASNMVRAIYEDAEGVLWIGTYDGGLSRFQGGKFFNFTIDSGLFNNGVFAILEDRRNNFWISCNKGIYRVNRGELNEFAEGRIEQINSVAYGKSDGLLSTECNGGRQPAGIIARDGKMWFPTQDGVAVVDSEAITANPLPPPVEIESVAIDRNNVAFNGGVQIRPSETSLDLTYTALSLNKSELIRFRYKMEGLDKEWVDAGTQRTAYYSYLPAGEYTFRVIAANSDGVWNNEGKSIKVIVIPAIYRRWWFVGLAGLIALASALGVYRYRVEQLRKIHETREAFSRQLLESKEAFSRQLLESQEAERKRIAAELHDSLGQNLLVIKNRALIALSRPDDYGLMAEQVDEISSMISQSLEDVRQIARNLRPYQLDRLGLTMAIESIITNVSNTTAIRFTSEIDPIDGVFTPESEINLFRIVQESVNNIIKHSEATEAIVRIRRNEVEITLTVEDNGKGFAMEAKDGQSKRGFGLSGMEERIRILGGKYVIHATPGRGTIISILIEYEKAGK